jgi:hypothetical protein
MSLVASLAIFSSGFRLELPSPAVIIMPLMTGPPSAILASASSAVRHRP